LVWLAIPAVEVPVVLTVTARVTVWAEDEVELPEEVEPKLQLIYSVEGNTPGAPLMPVPASHGQEKPVRVTFAGKTKLTLPVLPLVAPEVMFNCVVLDVEAALTVTERGLVTDRIRPVTTSVPVTVTV
jgi:hypothetical protein